MKIQLLAALIGTILSIRIKDKAKARGKERAKIRNTLRSAAKQVEAAQMVYYEEVGGKKQCKWGGLQRRISKYPTIVKDHYRASGAMCDPDPTTTLPTCRTMTEVLDYAAKIACEYPAKLTDDDTVYYVNTRRLQNEDVFSVYKDYLNQFTFAILPSKKDAINEDYVARIFSVVIPADNGTKPDIKPYVDEVCPFDYSLDFDIDPTARVPIYLIEKKDGKSITTGNALKQGTREIDEILKRSKCFYNLAKDTKVMMRFHETEDFKKYQKLKNELEAGRDMEQ